MLIVLEIEKKISLFEERTYQRNIMDLYKNEV